MTSRSTETEHAGATDFVAQRVRAVGRRRPAPAADAGLRVTRVRSSITCSRPGGWACLPRLLLPFRLGLGGWHRLRARQYIKWISIDDEVPRHPACRSRRTAVAGHRCNLTGPASGHERRVHQDPGPRGSAPDGDPDAAVPAAGAVRQRARPAPARSGGPTRAADQDSGKTGYTIRAPDARGGAACGCGSTPTSARTLTTPRRCSAPRGAVDVDLVGVSTVDGDTESASRPRSRARSSTHPSCPAHNWPSAVADAQAEALLAIGPLENVALYLLPAFFHPECA